MNKLLTQAAYAKYRKVSRQRIGQLAKAGRIELVNGLIDVARADAGLKHKATRAKHRQASDRATTEPVRGRECVYECDRCSMPIPMDRHTPLPARLICPNCGTDIIVVGLAELKMK